MREVIDPVQLEKILTGDPELGEKLRHIITEHNIETDRSTENKAILEYIKNTDLRAFHMEEDAENNRGPEPADEELLALIGGGANLYQQAEGLNRNSWFVSLLEKYLSIEINEE